MSTDGEDFLGVHLARLTLGEAVAAVTRLANGPDFHYVVTPNVDHVVALNRASFDERGAAFRQSYAQADLVLCDSRVLARLAHWSGLRLSVVPGSDLTAALFERGVLVGRKVAIVGGDRGLMDALHARFPGPHYLHTSPPMGVLRDPAAQAAIVDFVTNSGAEVTLFAIGAPQSELVALACKQGARARGVGLCVGASLEFLLGHKRRAPAWMQRLGLEWSHRLMTEPRRLWRRYLVEGPTIFAVWWRYRRAER